MAGQTSAMVSTLMLFLGLLFGQAVLQIQGCGGGGGGGSSSSSADDKAAQDARPSMHPNPPGPPGPCECTETHPFYGTDYAMKYPKDAGKWCHNWFQYNSRCTEGHERYLDGEDSETHKWAWCEADYCMVDPKKCKLSDVIGIWDDAFDGSGYGTSSGQVWSFMNCDESLWVTTTAAPAAGTGAPAETTASP